VAGIGSEISITFQPLPLLPLRLHWVARIIEFEWNHYFSDEQIEGPFEYFRHRHGIDLEVRDKIAGTRVTDSIEFALPLGWLGSLGTPLVRMLLARSFHQRQRRLPDLLRAALNQFDGSR
jgi:ligand-binding SRPBCC domain-containing protein